MLEYSQMTLQELYKALEKLDTKIAENSWCMSQEVYDQMYHWRELLEQEIYVREEIGKKDKDKPVDIFSDGSHRTRNENKSKFKKQNDSDRW